MLIRSLVAETVTLTLFPRKKPKKKLKWAEDTVDNENMGRKKSKKCCVFHKKKRFDESSSDESDTSDSEGGDRQCDHKDCPLNYCQGFEKGVLPEGWRDAGKRQSQG